jgi:hypothetical protein
MMMKHNKDEIVVVGHIDHDKFWWMI